MHDRAPDKVVEHTLLLVLLASPVMFARAQDDSPWFVAGAASTTFRAAAQP